MAPEIAHLRLTNLQFVNYSAERVCNLRVRLGPARLCSPAFHYGTFNGVGLGSTGTLAVSRVGREVDGH